MNVRQELLIVNTAVLVNLYKFCCLFTIFFFISQLFASEKKPRENMTRKFHNRCAQYTQVLKCVRKKIGMHGPYSWTHYFYHDDVDNDVCVAPKKVLFLYLWYSPSEQLIYILWIYYIKTYDPILQGLLIEDMVSSVRNVKWLNINDWIDVQL